MTTTPLFSIIIPCYNCSAYISETIDSLLQQSIKDFEVLCINDGSIDNTFSILNKYKNECKQIRVFNQNNSGVSYSRNRGILEAHGKYILFLDSDDVINLDTLNIVKDILSRKEFDTVYFRFSRTIENAISFDYKNGIQYIKGNQTDAMTKLLYEMDKYSFACFTYKKELLDKYSIRFDEATKHFEDREFNWKYLCHCNDTCWIDAPLYGYRINRKSVTENAGETWDDDGIKAAIRVEKYLAENKCSFYGPVKNYLLPRVLWSKAKSYSLAAQKQFFIKLGNEYNLKGYFKSLINDKSIIVSLTSIIYIIYPNLFYMVLSIWGSRKKKNEYG